MEEQTQNNPQSGDDAGKSCCSSSKCCHCKAVAGIAIIALVWVAPSWANIGITVLAALIILGSGHCFCKKDK